MTGYLLIGSALALVAVLSTRFAQRIGVPALILFVGIGVLAGRGGLGSGFSAGYELSLNLGLLALAVILFSGGLDMRAEVLRAAALPAGLLATVGVVLKTVVIGALAWFLTPLDVANGLLLGAILAPTDAAAVFSVLKGQGLPDRLRGVLEAESGMNDPVSIFLTVTLVGLVTSGTLDVAATSLDLLLQLGLGAALGYGFGRGLVALINSTNVDNFGLYPVLALAGGLFAYAATDALGGNGFLAVYIVGVVLGNRPLVHRQTIRQFMDGVAWGAQISMFLLLGLLAVPADIGAHLPMALGLTAGLIVLARPASVLLILTPLGWVSRRYRLGVAEQLLLSWAGLKGAVPIILAIFPLLSGVPESSLLFNVVFVSVVLGTAIQGSTIGRVARWLGLAAPPRPEPPMRIELTGKTPAGTAVVDVFLTGDAPAIGRKLSQLDLPDDLVVAAIHRDGALVPPRGHVEFRTGDHVFLIGRTATLNAVPHAFVPVATAGDSHPASTG